MAWWGAQVKGAKGPPSWGGLPAWGPQKPAWSKTSVGKGKWQPPDAGKGKSKAAGKGKLPAGKGKLRPGGNLSRQQLGNSRRQGALLEWKGRFGWLALDVPIDHPEAHKNDYRVFLGSSDLGDISEEALVEGARLSFVAYADGKGIGAQDVRLEDDSMESATPDTRAGPGAGWGVKRTIEKKLVPAGKGKKAPAAPALLATPKAKGSSKAAQKSGKGTPPAAKGPAACRGPPGCRREKTTHSGQHGMLMWASSEMQGWRPAMEDAVVALTEMPSPLESCAMFGVFDGHGGGEVSRKTAAELPDIVVELALSQADGDLPLLALEQAMPVLDAKLRQDGEGEAGMLPGCAGGKPIVSDVKNAFGLMGSTAIVALLECEGSNTEGWPSRVVVANVGDSRAALCRAGEAIELSEDHKPDNDIERARIEAAGGFVAAVGPCQRVDGWGLNLSRALGDFHYKARDDLPFDEQKVSCQPDMRVEKITEQDEFLFLGCDGVFELHSTQGAIDIARAAIMEGKPLTQVVEELVDACCSPDLMRTQGHGGDNVSAMIVMLRPDVAQN